MRKLITIVVLIIFGLSVHAADRYVATAANGGSNSNAGTLASPWLTLSYACFHSVSPDIIHVASGPYTESSQCVLAVGVSIIGDGMATTTIISHYAASLTDDTDASIVLLSGSSTNGNQSISGITINGDGLTGTRAIAVNFRNNVEIHHCTIVDFLYSGIYFNGTNYTWYLPMPPTHSTGNSVHDCVITNCSHAATVPNHDYGHIMMGAQQDFLIYNNTITEADLTRCGDMLNGEWHKGMKIYNNVFTKPDNVVSNWNFFGEIFFIEGGVEIYNNTFNGIATLDFVDVRKGSYSFGVKIYGNTFTSASQGPINEHGIQAIDFEERGAIQYVYVYNNHFKNTHTGVQFDVIANATYKSDQTGAANNSTTLYVDHCYVYYNIFENLGNTINNWYPAVVIKPEGLLTNNNVIFDNIYIDNNTMVSGATYKGYAGVLIQGTTTMTNIYVRNNIIQGFASNGILYAAGLGTPSGTTHYIQDNLLYINSSNTVGFDGITVSGINYTPTSGVYSTSNPIFVSTTDFHLQSTSPALNHGIPITTPVITTDYDNATIGSPPEIGAYEYGTSVSAPTVTTTDVSNIATTTAVSGGTIVSNGGSSVTVSGICWGTSTNPTTANSKTIDGTTSGSWADNITGLTQNTIYHVRAYATNAVNTAYGADVQFTSALPKSTYKVRSGGKFVTSGGKILVTQ
jgi:hypothetical protein